MPPGSKHEKDKWLVTLHPGEGRHRIDIRETILSIESNAKHIQTTEEREHSGAFTNPFVAVEWFTQDGNCSVLAKVRETEKRDASMSEFFSWMTASACQVATRAWELTYGQKTDVHSAKTIECYSKAFNESAYYLRFELLSATRMAYRGDMELYTAHGQLLARWASFCGSRED